MAGCNARLTPVASWADTVVSKRLPNPRRAKIHRNYTVAEIATLYTVHRNTVREWIKHGLPT
jgi:hypothetical protein